MASLEAVFNLKHGPSQWKDYISDTLSGTSSQIDLSGADLDEFDFRGYDLTNCLLGGARLTGCNFDGQVLKDVNFTGAHLSSSSFVGCQMIKANFSDTQCHNLTLRNSSISHSTIELSGQVENLQIEHCTFRSTKIFAELIDGMLKSSEFIKCEVNLEAQNCEIELALFEKCVIHRLGLAQSKLTHSRVLNSRIAEMNMREASVSDVRIARSRLDHLQCFGYPMSRVDLEETLLTGIDLRHIGLSSAHLMGARFVDCALPEQRGQVSITGCYRASDQLMVHPVQDTYGLSPTERREVADAQYIVERVSQSRGFVDPTLLRIWGATSGFGQSVARLLACAATAFWIHVILLLAVRTQLVWGGTFSIEILYRACLTILGCLVGSIDFTSQQNTFAEVMVLGSARLFGFVELGLLVGIAANRLGRLSSL